VDEAVFEGIKALAAPRQRSMEAECHRLRDKGLRRRQRWDGAAPAGLKPAFVRSDDAPREAAR